MMADSSLDGLKRETVYINDFNNIAEVKPHLVKFVDFYLSTLQANKKLKEKEDQLNNYLNDLTK